MSCQTVTGLSSHVKHHRFMPTAEYRTDNNPRLATRSRRRETIQVNDLLNVIQSYLPALPLKVSDKLKKKSCETVRSEFNIVLYFGRFSCFFVGKGRDNNFYIYLTCFSLMFSPGARVASRDLFLASALEPRPFFAAWSVDIFTVRHENWDPASSANTNYRSPIHQKTVSSHNKRERESEGLFLTARRHFNCLPVSTLQERVSGERSHLHIKRQIKSVLRSTFLFETIARKIAPPTPFHLRVMWAGVSHTFEKCSTYCFRQ